MEVVKKIGAIILLLGMGIFVYTKIESCTHESPELSIPSEVGIYGSSGYDAGYSSHDSYNHSTNSSDELEEIEPQTRYVQCPICYGTGRCGVCGGSGTVYKFGEWQDCDLCHGDGLCGYCEGRGLVEEAVWN